jgi:cell wall assembly regulator SMI1
MEQNPFVRTQAPAGSADLQAVEQKYNFVLPDDYKAHILANNGGRPTRRTFMQLDADGQVTERKLRSFYPVKNGDDTLENALQSLHDQLHPHLIPFGEESGGDQFVLSVGPEDYGSVYYVAHEFYHPSFSDNDSSSALSKQALQYGEGVYFLAPSFTAFLEGLVVGTPTE